MTPVVGDPGPPIPEPSLTVPYILAVITTVAGLFATQGWITNGVTKAVAGLAAVLVPLGIAAVHTLAKARIHQAKIAARAALTK